MKRIVKASKSSKLHNMIDRARWEMRGGKTAQEAADSVAEEFGLAKDGNIYNYMLECLQTSYSGRRITADSDVETFLKYHEDMRNHDFNPSGFDKMYEILDKYGDDSETVDVVFERATPEDKKKMIELITPIEIRPGDKGYAQKLYYGALEGKFPREMRIDEYSKDYCEGIVDAIDTLFAEGWVDEQAFRTDL